MDVDRDADEAIEATTVATAAAETITQTSNTTTTITSDTPIIVAAASQTSEIEAIEADRKSTIDAEVADAIIVIQQQEAKEKRSSTVTNSSFNYATYVPAPSNSHVVVRGFHGVRSDELTLEVGDIVGIDKMYADGWALGKIISKKSKIGVFPITVLTRQKHGASQSVGHSETGHTYFMPKKRHSNSSNASIEQLYAHQVPERGASMVEVESSTIRVKVQRDQDAYATRMDFRENRNRWERQSAGASTAASSSGVEKK
ncbi:hypothetical protein HDU78_004107 [Chytriomyces hyalinus]|nr:hypothetical protein HDU78_004107 [Chytriomyces hyalinus]